MTSTSAPPPTPQEEVMDAYMSDAEQYDSGAESDCMTDEQFERYAMDLNCRPHMDRVRNVLVRAIDLIADAGPRAMPVIIIRRVDDLFVEAVEDVHMICSIGRRYHIAKLTDMTFESLLLSLPVESVVRYGAIKDMHTKKLTEAGWDWMVDALKCVFESINSDSYDHVEWTTHIILFGASAMGSGVEKTRCHVLKLLATLHVIASSALEETDLSDTRLRLLLSCVARMRETSNAGHITRWAVLCRGLTPDYAEQYKPTDDQPDADGSLQAEFQRLSDLSEGLDLADMKMLVVAVLSLFIARRARFQGASEPDTDMPDLLGTHMLHGIMVNTKRYDEQEWDAMKLQNIMPGFIASEQDARTAREWNTGVRDARGLVLREEHMNEIQLWKEVLDESLRADFIDETPFVPTGPHPESEIRDSTLHGWHMDQMQLIRNHRLEQSFSKQVNKQREYEQRAEQEREREGVSDDADIRALVESMDSIGLRDASSSSSSSSNRTVVPGTRKRLFE